MMEGIFSERTKKILAELRNRKPLPEPVDVLPKLPIITKEKFRSIEKYQIKSEGGHYVVYLNGEFYCSADTKGEAMNEICS